MLYTFRLIAMLHTSISTGNDNNNNNNNHDDIYSAVIVAEPLREFTQFTR